MIFERRRYTAREGMHDEFIRLQHVRGFDGAIGAIMARLIGYFSTISGASEQFIHLYRYDDFADWLNRLHGLYGVPDLEPYFQAVRPILSKQESEFFVSAPIDELNPLWTGGSDWLPRPNGRLWDLRKTPDLIVEESTIALAPGGLPRFWSATAEFGPEMPSAPEKDRLATWHSMTGRLHVVVSYTVFATAADRDALHDARRSSDARAAFAEAVRDTVISNETAYLKPVPVPEMSPMFLLDK